MRRLLIFLGLVLLSASAGAERIKDIAHVAGVRENQLVGYGLVVGLDGTGDQTSQTPFTVQSLQNMLHRRKIKGKAVNRFRRIGLSRLLWS